MRVFVNAVALNSAGGRSVGINFLRALKEAPIQGAFDFDVFVPPGVGYEALSGGAIRIYPVPQRLLSLTLRFYLDAVWLPRWVRALQPDVVFSMGNLALPVPNPQLVLFHWPYAIYPESPVWERMSVRGRWLRRLRLRTFQSRLAHADAIVAQTVTSKKRLERLFAPHTAVHVVPNAVSLPSPSTIMYSDESKAWGQDAKGMNRLLCLTRYYPHKNLEVLLLLAEQIRDGDLPFRIVTTVAAQQDPAAAVFLQSIRSRGLTKVLRNIGPVSMERVPGLYNAADGLLLPTLLESFSGTYIEAQYYGVPVFTSDLDFAHEGTGRHAFYFNPLDPDAILQTLTHVFADHVTLRQRVKAARAYVASQPGWPEVARQYLDLLRQVASRKEGQAFVRTEVREYE